MRVLLHEFAGYAFVIDLARALAHRGHEVTFAYSPDVPSGKGEVELGPDAPESLFVVPVALPRGYERYSPMWRLRDEAWYGRRAARLTMEVRPDVVISSNMPLLAQAQILRSSHAADAGFVYWLQDLLGIGIADQLARRFGPVGRFLGAFFAWLERLLLRRSDALVVISNAFGDVLDDAGVDSSKVRVVENWAPVEEIPLLAKDNPWAREHGLHDRTVLLYSGTLGLKHDPDYLVRLGGAFADRNDVAVVLVSEGIGADHVRAATDDVLVLPFQPYERLPEVLATADVLLALLEPSAGRFSVPSKILTYQCASRPTLAAMPLENAAAQQLQTVGSGVVVPVGNRERFIDEARRLVDDAPRRKELGKRGREHAEATFGIDSIAMRFEQVLAATHRRR